VQKLQWYYAVMFQVSFCPMLYPIFRDVNRKQTAVIAYPEGQMCTCTGNHCKLAQMCSSDGSQSTFSNKKFYGRSLYS
jgi:hypothetical protein